MGATLRQAFGRGRCAGAPRPAARLPPSGCAHAPDLHDARRRAEIALRPNSADEDVELLSHEIDVELEPQP